MANAKLFGESSVLGGTISSAAYTQYLRFQAPSHGIARVLRHYCQVACKCKMALYSDSGAAPALVLAQSAMEDVSAASWAELDISDVAIVSGSYYWLAFHTNGYVNYASSGGLSRKYKATTFSAAYTFTDNPSGLSTDTYNLSEYCEGVLTLAPTGIASEEAFGSPSLTLIIAPSGIASLESFGSPSLELEGNYICPSGIASLEALGSPVVINRQVITPPSIPSSFAAGSHSVVLQVQVIAPAGIPSAFAAGTPGLYQGNITFSGIPSGEACGALSVLRDRLHIIIEGVYDEVSPSVNRAFIVGQDATGNVVSASDSEDDEIGLVGERLTVEHDTEVLTAAMAGYVAAAVLAKSRLGSRQADITIPPHCGIEMWDVVNVLDEYGNQSADYRVAGYTFEYSVLDSHWRHRLDLCAP